MAGQTARTCGPGHRAAMASSQCPRSDAQHFLFHGCHPQGGQLALCNQTGCATSSTRPSIENDSRWAGVSTGPLRTGLLAGARQTRYSAVGNGPWLAKMWCGTRVGSGRQGSLGISHQGGSHFCCRTVWLQLVPARLCSRVPCPDASGGWQLPQPATGAPSCPCGWYEVLVLHTVDRTGAVLRTMGEVE